MDNGHISSSCSNSELNLANAHVSSSCSNSELNLGNAHVSSINIPSPNDNRESIFSQLHACNNTGNQSKTIPSSFGDLNGDIQKLNENSVYDFKKDYKYYEGDIAYKSGISIVKDNLTINGNGHIIDASNAASIFNIRANNVKISNLTFINSIYNDRVNFIDRAGAYQSLEINNLSCINWQGDNGVLSYCLFEDNAAVNGGAIYWAGNNGLIDNIIALNNTASGVGGVIYIAGTNNMISNSLFLNFKSIIGEAIYIDPQYTDCIISNVEFDSPILFVDGSLSNINPNHFYKSYVVDFSDKKVDLIKILYISIMWNITSRYDDSIVFYSQYNEKTKDFELILNRDFSNGFSFRKVFHFSKIENFEDVFQNLLNQKFSNELTLIKHCNVTNINDYNYACSFNRDNLLDDPSMKCILLDFWNNPLDMIVYALDVQFTRPLEINSNINWNTNKKMLDVINVNGNGSKIVIKNNEKEEYKWASIGPNCVFCVENMTIQGFNTAIENLGGSCILNNISLDGNRINYAIARDWGGAILNAGYCQCNNCTFSNNYAKNGGAIFNQGLLNLNSCTFTNNHGYGNGDDVLTADKAIVKIDNVEIEDSQGPIKFVKSLSATERKVIEISSYVLSFSIGFIIGFFTANPTIGTWAGAGVGAALGTIASTCIIAYTYDINFNRFATAFSLISNSISLGMLGGTIGGFVGRMYYMSNARLAKGTAKMQEMQEIKTIEKPHTLSPEEINQIKQTDPNKFIEAKCLTPTAKKCIVKVKGKYYLDLAKLYQLKPEEVCYTFNYKIWEDLNQGNVLLPYERFMALPDNWYFLGTYDIDWIKISNLPNDLNPPIVDNPIPNPSIIDNPIPNP